MDVVSYLPLQSDMASLFDQYLFKDQNYESTVNTPNLVMSSEGYNNLGQCNFGEDDFSFPDLQLQPQHHHHTTTNNTNCATNGIVMSPQQAVADTDHSLADIFTSPIITNLPQQQDQGNGQYNEFSVSSNTSSYASSQRFGAQPIYTTSELRPPVGRGPQPSMDRLAMRSPQQQHLYSTPSHNHITPTSHGQRYNTIDRRPSSTGSASIGSSPPGSIHTSPGRESEDSDDSVPISQVNSVFPLPTTVGMKRSPEPDDNVSSTLKSKPAKKPKVPKKKKKRDPNEPQKPVSAYALFFRDTQAAIKGQNPNASFGEVSKVVASMWDGLDADHKNVYKKKTEAAKKEYLKALAAYRASIVCRTAPEHDLNLNNSMSRPPQQMSMLQKKSPLLTSLMDNSSSRQQYAPPTTMNPAYTSKVQCTSPMEAYPSYRPPIYKPQVTMGFQRPTTLSVNSYAQPPVNKNIISNQVPNQGLMEMAPNSSPPVMTMDSSLPAQQQHQGLTNMQSPSQVMRTSPPQMPVPSATSTNQFINNQGGERYEHMWSSSNSAARQYIPANGSSSSPYSPRTTSRDSVIGPSGSSAEYNSFNSNDSAQPTYNQQQFASSATGTNQYDDCSSISQSYYRHHPPSSEFIPSDEANLPERRMHQSRC